jgi:diguanylate cyclase (GGDEF)-like protein/PAS domain S-box-containing protein
VFRARRTGDALSFGDVTDYASLVPRGERVEAPTAVTTNAWDGTRRFTSARELFDFPVAVVVGLSEEEYLAPVNERIDAYIWRALGGSAVLLLFLAGVGYMSWQLTQTRVTTNRALREEVDTRRHAEAALRLRNRAIDSSVNAILIMDVARQYYPIEYVNPAFERITGYSFAEAAGRNIGFLVGAERDQTGMQEIQMALRERREGHAVLRNYRKDGTLFWNDFHIAPVRDEDGNVTHFVGVMNDVTEAKTYEEQLARQANFDTLTGLANRNLLQDRLHQAIANAKRSSSTVAAVFLDVDNFKLVNDTLGHKLGDELLQKLAARLKTCVRESDTVARLGGDEFVLLLLNPAAAESPFGGRKDGEASSLESDITLLMHKLLTNIAHPIALGGRELRPTSSIGVAVYPQDGEDADTLLRNADAAMYRAKELGRNRFQFFTADVHERIRRRMELESSLRFAIEREEFELFYQPQVSFRTGRVVGVEALLRWRHPQKGLVEPSHFIGFAEESGLINPIGTWVLQKACSVRSRARASRRNTSSSRSPRASPWRTRSRACLSWSGSSRPASCFASTTSAPGSRTSRT